MQPDLIPQLTPTATALTQNRPQSFFARPCQQLAPELIGFLLVKRQPSFAFLWRMIVETEAYCQSEPACHGKLRRSPSNEMLVGETGRFDVGVSYGIHHRVRWFAGGRRFSEASADRGCH